MFTVQIKTIRQFKMAPLGVDYRRQSMLVSVCCLLFDPLRRVTQCRRLETDFGNKRLLIQVK